MKRKYHGWIFIEKSVGMKDYFSVQVRATDKDPSHIHPTGYGEQGAAKAVDYFETRLQLGHVKLETTPLGLRVFTEEEEPSLPVGEDLTKIGGEVTVTECVNCGNPLPKSRQALGFVVCGDCLNIGKEDS